MENMFELTPRFDRAKSFYKKAFVIEDENGYTLYSYNTKVCAVSKAGVINLTGWYSRTTSRHIKEFLKQFEYLFQNKDEYYKLRYSNYSKKELENIMED